MPEEINNDRRRFLGKAAMSLAAAEFGMMASAKAHASNSSSAGAAAIPAKAGTAADDTSIRPFHISFPDADLADLRRRIAAAKWPERELVSDATQGVQLATMQRLAHYWATDYDWRKVEARLNALPQFVTNIDGLDIHFIHVRSKNANALPIIITHGWPGSIIEQLKIIGPLTDPTAYGGRADDAFDVVIPSLPGYGFSGKPTMTGWDPDRIARAWILLMKRLGYTRYVAQGGDWGNCVTELMALKAPPELLGMHTNMAATVPADIDKAALAGAPPPSNLSADQLRAYNQLAFFYKHGLGYAIVIKDPPRETHRRIRDPVQRLRAPRHFLGVAKAVLIEKGQLVVSAQLVG